MSRAGSRGADAVQTAGVLIALLVLPFLAACGRDTARVATPSPDAEAAAPAAACEPARGPGMTVVGAFDTTVGGVRQWQAQQVAMDAERAGTPSSSVGRATWASDKSAGTKTVLCYLDGTVNKAPPPASDGTAPTPFNRDVVAVLEDGSVIAVTLGYRENIPVHAPPP